MNSLSEPGLAALSDTVLQLHRGSRNWPAASFAQRACELLQAVVPFDACLWSSARAGAVPGAALALQGLYSQGLDNQALALCMQGGSPGTVLSAEHPEPLSQRRVELHLWRFDAAAAFSAGEQGALQFLMPHLVETQRENRLGRATVDDQAPTAARSHALCDLEGALLDLDLQCLALLRVEWPRWCAPALPEPLRRAVLDFAGAAIDNAHTNTLAARPIPAGPAATAPATLARNPPPAAFHGRQVTVLLTRCGEAVLLEVRRRAAVDRLSERQRSIAELYARGRTGAMIAAQLELAESTVNNHLGAIFRKLAVSSKLQLADAMRSGGLTPHA